MRVPGGGAGGTGVGASWRAVWRGDGRSQIRGAPCEKGSGLPARRGLGRDRRGEGQRLGDERLPASLPGGPWDGAAAATGSEGRVCAWGDLSVARHLGRVT